MSITNVPSAVFLDHIVPHLEVKEIGSLSMVSKDLKEFCDDNLVWREMYLRTIRCVIVDSSVHYGDVRDTISSTFGIMTNIVADDGTLLSKCSFSRRWRGARCLPNDVRLKIPRINPARVNGFRLAQIEGAAENTLLLEERMKYSKVILGTWQEHNRGLGSSTVNLCQCAGHYQFNTLAVPASCKNSKSYKTTVLSKMRTQAKNPLTSLNAMILRNQAEIQRLHVLLRSSWWLKEGGKEKEKNREYLKWFIAREAKLKASHATKSHIYNNLDTAVTSMKECVIREKEAKKATRMAKKKENEEKKAARLAKKEAKKSKKQ
jgi:hypothetical protein